MFNMVDKQIKLNGTTVTYKILPHPGSVCVLPLRAGQVALIRQFRPAIEKHIWEAPAGTRNAGEDPLLCAHRELTEETGLIAAQMQPLAAFYVCPGYSTEFMYLFLASELSQGARRLDKDEQIEEPVWFDLATAAQMIAAGEIIDAKTIIAIKLASAVD